MPSSHPEQTSLTDEQRWLARSLLQAISRLADEVAGVRKALEMGLGKRFEVSGSTKSWIWPTND